MHQNPAFDLKEGTEDTHQELVDRLREKTDSNADLAVRILLQEGHLGKIDSRMNDFNAKRP
jgi:hypothetical protein